MAYKIIRKRINGRNPGEVKYAWCGYWNGVCKAIYADIPGNELDLSHEIETWVFADGADMLKRLPLKKAKKELVI